MKFGQVSEWKKHNVNEPWRLERDDELIEATWSGFHNAYDCKTINTITGEEGWSLLTDADLKNAEVL